MQQTNFGFDRKSESISSLKHTWERCIHLLPSFTKRERIYVVEGEGPEEVAGIISVEIYK